MPGPPPPPPPMMDNKPVKKFVIPATTSGSGDPRNALLGQIQKGTKLKQVKTVDKSAPLIAGKITGDPGQPSSRSKGQTTTVKTSQDSITSSPMRKPPGGFANITDELQFKLTLKKNKTSPTKETNVVLEQKETSPPASSNTFINEIKSKQSVISSNQSSSPSPTISDSFANKSSLFNKPQVGCLSTVPNPQKIINHGKPNLAPKPPPQLKLVTSGNSLSGESNRKVVARHQSMKSPRSPPVTTSPTGPFNSDNHFGTIRMNPSNHQKIQDALNFQAPMPKPSAQRPTNRPPPPPVPSRLPGTNLTNNHAKSTNALNLSNIEQNLSAPRHRLPNSGSSNNISNMDNTIDSIDASAPPLPPHRLSSGQLRTPQPQVIAPNNNQAPPEVPRRHSSMRNSVENGANGKYSSPNSSQPITRLIVDLESRYSLLFHNVSEFPAPRPFMKLDKSYPSRGVRQANGI